MILQSDSDTIGDIEKVNLDKDEPGEKTSTSFGVNEAIIKWYEAP